MGSEWRTYILGKHCSKIGSGATPRGGSKVYLSKGEISLIRSQNVYNSGFAHEGLVYISPEHANQLSNVEVLSGDVLLNITGDSVARCCQVVDEILPARVNQHVAIVRPNPDTLDPRFLRYYLISPAMQAKMLSWASAGGTRKALTKGMIESFEIYAPQDVPEQRAIAHILGTLDDKIELNRRMNETLEAMARALFKSWFVDFDPVVVNARKAGNPIPDKFARRAAWYGRAGARPDDNPAVPALPDHILTLFPDSFQDSELGPIPRGWEVSTIGQEVQCVGGSTPSTKNPVYWEGGRNPFVTPKDMSALTSPVIMETSRYITDDGVKKISSGRLPVGTVLLSSRAPIGYLAITEISASVNQGIIAMICNKVLPNYYVLFWTEENMDVIKSKAGGTTFAEISKRNFRPIPVLVPDRQILEMFVEQVEPLYKQIVSNLQESRTLAALRDTLLPKLISGELRVPDVERFLAEAGV